MRATLFALALVLPATTFASEWTIDPMHTSSQFSVRHMMVSTVRGSFGKTTGTVTLDDKDPTRSSIHVEIEADSIDTREPKRDAHLRSPDFFDVAKYPKLTFVSTRVEKTGTSRYKVTGDLTMHGQTHPVTLDVEGPSAAQKGMGSGLVRGVSATGKLSRKQWGLNWNKAIEAGGVAVGDEVTLTIDTELDSK